MLDLKIGTGVGQVNARKPLTSAFPPVASIRNFGPSFLDLASSRPNRDEMALQQELLQQEALTRRWQMRTGGSGMEGRGPQSIRGMLLSSGRMRFEGCCCRFEGCCCQVEGCGEIDLKGAVVNLNNAGPTVRS